MIISLIKYLNIVNKILGLPFLNNSGEIELPSDVAITGPDSDIHLEHGQKLTIKSVDGITRLTAVFLSGADDRLEIGENSILKASATTQVNAAGGSGQLLLVAGGSGFLIDKATNLITCNLSINFNSETRNLNSSYQWAYANGVITGGTTPVWQYEHGFGTTITRNGAGDYSVTFGTAFGSADYAPICTALADGYNVSAINPLSAGFDIKILNAAGALTDADVSVIIFGKSI